MLDRRIRIAQQLCCWFPSAAWERGSTRRQSQGQRGVKNPVNAGVNLEIEVPCSGKMEGVQGFWCWLGYATISRFHTQNKPASRFKFTIDLRSPR